MSGSSPRGTPGPDNNVVAKRKPRAAPVPAARKTALPQHSPPPASSPLTANFAINRTAASTAERPLSARARKNSMANSVASFNAQEALAGRRPSSSQSVQQITNNSAIAEIEQAAGAVSEITPTKDAVIPQDVVEAPQPFDIPAMKVEDSGNTEPESMEIDMPTSAPVTTRAGRTPKTSTPTVGTFPEIPMVRSRSTRNANNGNSHSNTSSEKQQYHNWHCI